MMFSRNPEVTSNRVSLLWFNKFLEYIVKCITKAINMIKRFFKYSFKIMVSESDNNKDSESVKGILKNKLNASWKGFIDKAPLVAGTTAAVVSTLGLTSAIVLIAIGLWIKASGKVVTKLKSNPSLFEKLTKKTKKFFGIEEDDIPDDLQPPDIDVPNVNLGNLQLSESITSHMVDRVKITTSEIIIKAVFLLCLKAVLSFYMCEALATTLTIMTALFVPGLNLITYILLWIFIGICAIIRKFRKPKLSISYDEGKPDNA